MSATLNPGALPIGEQWELFLVAAGAAAYNSSSPEHFEFAINSIEVLAGTLEPWLGSSVLFSASAPFSTASFGEGGMRDEMLTTAGELQSTAAGELPSADRAGEVH